MISVPVQATSRRAEPTSLFPSAPAFCNPLSRSAAPVSRTTPTQLGSTATPKNNGHREGGKLREPIPERNRDMMQHRPRRNLAEPPIHGSHPPSQTVRLKWKDVVPLVEQLAFYFQTANQSRQPEALLFSELAKLPPHLLGASTNTRANRGQNLAALRHLFTRTLSGAERQHSEISAKTKA